MEFDALPLYAKVLSFMGMLAGITYVVGLPVFLYWLWDMHKKVTDYHTKRIIEISRDVLDIRVRTSVLENKAHEVPRPVRSY